MGRDEGRFVTAAHLELVGPRHGVCQEVALTGIQPVRGWVSQP
jgi:hypothetical protein